jgi:hypothetical protein
MYIYFFGIDNVMHKQKIFVIAAAILLTTVVAAALYSVEAANAQGNATSSSGNMTAGNATK